MIKQESKESVWCEMWGGPSVATTGLGTRDELRMAEPAGPGVAKHVRIEGEEGKEFFCFTDAHRGKDHVFRVRDRSVSVPWDEFRLAGKKHFLADEVTWK